MGVNWRPDLDPTTVRREIEIIHRDLHCTAIRIVGRDLGRLYLASQLAIDEGLEVWFCPTLWDQDRGAMGRYLERAARSVERRWGGAPDGLVFSVGGELTLFSKGILPGRTFNARMKRIGALRPMLKEGRLAGPLNELLVHLVRSVRSHFSGPITYAALAWEPVDWTPFDLVGVDHYLSSGNADRYFEMLRPSVETGKPVVITEFGVESYRGGPMTEGFLDSAGLKPSVVDVRSQLLHQLPLLGRWIRPRLRVPVVRDEAYQAEQLGAQLLRLEHARVDGAFVSQFISQIFPYDPDPRFDLDRASSSLVRYLERRRGSTYPDLPWEPKESFRAVADFYGSH